MKFSRTVYDASVMRFPTFEDDRGNLSFFESSAHIPFDIKRVYWVFDVPGGASRGEHAFKETHECVTALSGSFDVFLHDGYAEKVISLNRANMAVYIPNMIWRSFKNFSTNAVAFVVSSSDFNLSDYIETFDQYKNLNQGVSANAK